MPDHSDGKIRSGGFQLEEWVDKAASEFNYGVSGVAKPKRPTNSASVLNHPDVVLVKKTSAASILSGGPSRRNDVGRYVIPKPDKLSTTGGFVLVKPMKLGRGRKPVAPLSRAK